MARISRERTAALEAAAQEAAPARRRERDSAHRKQRGGHGAGGGSHDAAAQRWRAIRAAMADPGFYPGRPAKVELHETHVSCVFVAGERVYKLKKPVVFDFLDYGTPERRHDACERELRLNAPLAGDLYTAVRAIALRDGGFALAEEGEEAVEHVVEMRRYDEGATLAAAIAAGRVAGSEVQALAATLARFHASARPLAAADDPVATLQLVLDDNFGAVAAFPDVVAPARLHQAQRFAGAFLAGRGERLRARAAAGAVRACHGDLRAEHVLLGGPVRILDCIEFNDDLRTIDVGADLAFLVMDLIRLGRCDLADLLVASYRAAGGDPGEDDLLAFHAASKAWVRAKVALLRTREPASARALAAARAEALEHVALAERLSWRARRPLALILCGPPLSGKSHLARRLGELSGLPVLSSDLTRKSLAGLRPTQRGEASTYTPQMSARTYAALAHAAAERLDACGAVIVDGTFTDRRRRRAFAKATPSPAQPLFCECSAPAAVVAARAQERAEDASSVSDADAPIARRLAGEWEPLEADVPATRHLRLRTDQAVDAVVGDLLALLDRRLSAPPREGGAGAGEGP